MLLKHVIRQYYHIRKPRISTQNKQSLTQYRISLRQARNRVHIQAKQYQQMIQDQYLQNHSQQMKIKNFNNQCDFRKIIAQEGYKLKENIQYWKKQDQIMENKMNKYIHDEDVRRINRERIKKIMTYQSDNYWYTSQNAEERLTEGVIFPEYIASTEYYHRLHTQGLVYENYDFKMLHRVRSNQEVIKEKNKILIPIFNDIKLKIKQYKTDKEKQINYYHQIALDKINMVQNLSANERNRLIQQEKVSFEKKIAEYRNRLTDSVKRQNYIKQKLRILLSILGSWKQYTSILGMTSGQMMRQIEQTRRQQQITGIRKNVMNQIKSIKNTTFIDAIQQDTEDIEITLNDYIVKLKSQQSSEESVVEQKENVMNLELDGLLKEAESELKVSKSDLNTIEKSAKIDLGSMVEGIDSPTDFEVTEIPVSFLNLNETTASVEIMKEIYQNDEDMIKLLNQIGQVNVQYPKLFEKIWQSTHSVV